MATSKITLRKKTIFRSLRALGLSTGRKLLHPHNPYHHVNAELHPRPGDASPLGCAMRGKIRQRMNNNGKTRTKNKIMKQGRNEGNGAGNSYSCDL